MLQLRMGKSVDDANRILKEADGKEALQDWRVANGTFYFLFESDPHRFRGLAHGASAPAQNGPVVQQIPR